jgi:hypothetical protein
MKGINCGAFRTEDFREKKEAVLTILCITTALKMNNLTHEVYFTLL